MAYLDLAAFEGQPIATSDRRFGDLRVLDALDVAVVSVARQDAMNTLHERPSWRRWLGRLFGESPISPSLANDTLEALRRAAVHAWHGHVVLPDAERARLHRAGYSDLAYAAVLGLVARSRAAEFR